MMVVMKIMIMMTTGTVTMTMMMKTHMLCLW